jgi:hypothetical protein
MNGRLRRLLKEAFICIIVFLSGQEISLSSECSSFIGSFIHAKRKGVLQITPEDLQTQRGVFATGVKDPLTGKASIVNSPVVKIIPDLNTPLGRYANQLNKSGTGLFIDFEGFQKSSTSGYFSRLKDFRIIDPDELIFGNGHFGKAVVLPGGVVDNNEFVSTLMHEALHNKGETLREKGTSFRFNSVLRIGDEADSLQSASKGYEKFLHSEEVHTYTKDFINASIIAHNRETIKQIDEMMKKFPQNMKKSEKLDNIRINFDSVIDQRRFSNSHYQLNSIIKSHYENLKVIRKEIELYRSNRGLVKGSTLKIDRTNKNKLIIRNKDVSLTLLDVDAGEKRPNLVLTLRKINSMIFTDNVIKVKLEKIYNLKIKAEAKGYFTAAEYFQLKDEMGELSRVVRIKGEP